VHPDDISDALDRATRAANRAGLLPRQWAALPVCFDGQLAYGSTAWQGSFWYVVILPLPHRAPPVAVYRVKADLRLKRLDRHPWQLGPLAWDLFQTMPTREVERPGAHEGRVMTGARLHRRPD
jgi:hypothetical protein